MNAHRIPPYHATPDNTHTHSHTRGARLHICECTATTVKTENPKREMWCTHFKFARNANWRYTGERPGVDGDERIEHKKPSAIRNSERGRIIAGFGCYSVVAVHVYCLDFRWRGEHGTGRNFRQQKIADRVAMTVVLCIRQLWWTIFRFIRIDEHERQTNDSHGMLGTEPRPLILAN